MENLKLELKMKCNSNDSFNPLCFDNKIHIRLKNFNKERLVEKFEDKVAFVISFYLSVFVKLDLLDTKLKHDKLSVDYVWKKYSNKLDEKCLVTLTSEFSKRWPELEGFKLSPIYFKKGNYNPLAQICFLDENLCDEFRELLLKADLKISEFIFDKNVSLKIYKEDSDYRNIYSKYHNKVIRKIEKENKRSSKNKFIEDNLWDNSL